MWCRKGLLVSICRSNTVKTIYWYLRTALLNMKKIINSSAENKEFDVNRQQKVVRVDIYACSPPPHFPRYRFGSNGQMSPVQRPPYCHISTCHQSRPPGHFSWQVTAEGCNVTTLCHRWSQGLVSHCHPFCPSFFFFTRFPTAAVCHSRSMGTALTDVFCCHHLTLTSLSSHSRFNHGPSLNKVYNSCS